MKKSIAIIFKVLIIVLIAGIILYKITEGLKIHITNNTNKDIAEIEILYRDHYRGIIKAVQIPTIAQNSTYILKKASPKDFIVGEILISYLNNEGIKKQKSIAIFIDDGAAKSNVYVIINSIDDYGNLNLKVNNDFHF